MKDLRKLKEPFLIDEVAFLGKKNLYITEVGKDEIMMELLIDKTHLNPMEIAHGGAIYTLADTAAGVFINIQGEDCVTLHGSINYIKPVQVGNVKAHGIVRHRGNKTWVVDVEIIQEGEIKVRSTFTAFIVGKCESIPVQYE